MNAAQSHRIALVTGVSSGLGLGFAQALLEDGRVVYALSRREPDALRAALAENPAALERLHFRSVDLADTASIPGELQQLLERGPAADASARIDLAILNAGALGQIQAMVGGDLADMQATMQVNLWSNQVLLDTLLRQPNASETPGSVSGLGRKIQQVVLISSGASVNGNPGWSGYSLSKSAANMLMMLYAREVTDTHFCALAPGLIDTAMQDYMADSEAVDVARFPSVQRLRDARGTESMPMPYEAARRILPVIERLPDPERGVESGSFADVRKI